MGDYNVASAVDCDCTACIRKRELAVCIPTRQKLLDRLRIDNIIQRLEVGCRPVGQCLDSVSNRDNNWIGTAPVVCLPYRLPPTHAVVTLFGAITHSRSK